MVSYVLDKSEAFGIFCGIVVNGAVLTCFVWSPGWWLVQNGQGTLGWVPANYIQELHLSRKGWRRDGKVEGMWMKNDLGI